MATAPAEVSTKTSTRSALAVPEYRKVFVGSFGSQLGTWMQQVVLASYVVERFDSTALVGLVLMAQWGATLFLASTGGFLADRFSRKAVILVGQLAMLAGATALAIAAGAEAPFFAIFLAVLVTGSANALSQPAFNALVTLLAGREHIVSAVSLQSLSINVARVIGPLIGTVLYVVFSASWVFAVNAVTYLLVVIPVAFAKAAVVSSAERPKRSLIGNVRLAAGNEIVRRCLVTMAVFSLLCLPFVGLFPAIAEEYGIAPKSSLYGFLYAWFALGGVAGAAAAGSLTSRFDLRRLVTICLVVFAGGIAVMSTVRIEWTLWVTAPVAQTAYFALIVMLQTAIQTSIEEHIRGRIMSLWMMSWAGLLPVGVLLAGALAEVVGLATVTFGGATAALLLADRWWAYSRGGVPRVIPLLWLRGTAGEA